MKRFLLIALAILMHYCTFAQSTITGSFVHNGITRNYSFYVPASYDGSVAYPLVLNLHGYSSFAWQQSLYGDFKPIADTAGFIVVHPDGTVQTGTTSTQFWNVGFFPSAIDDVSFLENLIDTISAAYNINQTRVYSTGMSNGGFMSYHLACNSDRFAAIASVTGSMTTTTAGNCNPSKPVPVMEIHGTNDATVPYGGTTTFLHIDTVVNYWVSYNNIPNTPTIDSLPNLVTTDGATAIHYTYPAGDSGAVVELYKVIDGAHTWPGASFAIGVTCMDFSASKEIWRFFSQYGSNPAPTTITVAENWESQFKIFPNPAENYITFDAGTENEGILSIYDLNGRSVYNAQISSNRSLISIEQLPKGMYILEFKNEKGRLSKKFIKL